MSVMMLLKIFSDCCICFAILGTGPVSFSIPLLLPALLCGLGAAVATFFDRKNLSVLRCLSAVIPLCCLLLADSRAAGLLLAVPAVYASGVILRGRLELEYSGYRHYFMRSLILLAVVYAVALTWNFLTQITSTVTMQMNADVVLRYGLVHLLCGVVLQRQLRLGVGNRAAGGRRQLVSLVGTTTTLVVGFLAAEPLLRRSAGMLLRQALAVLSAPVGFVVEKVGRWISNLMRSDGDEEAYEEFMDHMHSIGLGGLAGDVQPGQVPVEPGLNATALWTILVGALLLVAAIILLRSFLKRTAELDSGEQMVRMVHVPKKKKAPVFSNRSRVRQVYRDFLRVEKNLGMKLKRSDTSEDVLLRIHKDTDKTGAAQLRQVYLLARYDDRENITRTHVEQARMAIKNARQSKKV